MQIKTRRGVLILGVGNILLKDEGLGVHVAEELQKQELPDNVEVIDGGTAGLDGLLSADGADKLIVIDAVRAGKKPGTIYKTRLDADQRFSQEQPLKISSHQLGLLDAIMAAEKIGCAPREIIIVGVEPGEVDCGLELTPAVKRAVGEVIKTVLEEIK